MSNHERTGQRDLTYSRWHRDDSIVRYLDGDKRLAYELAVVDIDWCECCRRCWKPLALIETQRSEANPKSATVTANLAALAGIQAWSVSYSVENGEIVRFKRRQLSPLRGEIIEESPFAYARWLVSLRIVHWQSCAHAPELHPVTALTRGR